MEIKIMSRFEKFQKIQILNDKNEPLNEQIFIHNFLVNFEDGYISNWYNESEDEMHPAIECVDAHIEYWEKGMLNRNNKPAVISCGDNIIECWENGKRKSHGKYHSGNKDENFRIGIKIEIEFAKYLNKNNIPFIHLDQPTDANKDLYSEALYDNNKKKTPDYIIFHNKKLVFVDVKALGLYTINKEELEKYNTLKKEFSKDIIYAIRDKNDENIDNYSFLTLNNITEYVEIFKKKTRKWEQKFYPISKKLLTNKIKLNKINDEKLIKYFNEERKGYFEKKYYYSDILKEYFESMNYYVKA
jgi:hypothetical protein